jgi:hypothetical protein
VSAETRTRILLATLRNIIRMKCHSKDRADGREVLAARRQILDITRERRAREDEQRKERFLRDE